MLNTRHNTKRKELQVQNILINSQFITQAWIDGYRDAIANRIDTEREATSNAYAKGIIHAINTGAATLEVFA